MPEGSLRRRLDQAMVGFQLELDELEARRREVEDKLEKLKSLASIVDDFPPDLQALLEGGEEDLANAVTGTEEQQTHFQRILRFFTESGNDYRTIADLEEETGIPRSSISAVLYQDAPEIIPSHGWSAWQSEVVATVHRRRPCRSY